METADKITQLENEIKVLKNEVQAVLLDIRENVLNAENPFNSQKQTISTQTIIDRQIQNNTTQPALESRPAPAVISEPAAVAIPAAVPLSVPAPAASVQAQAPKDAFSPPVNATEKSENYDPPVKNNDSNPREIHNMESKNNNGRQIETGHRQMKNADENEITPPRCEQPAARAVKGQPDLVAYAGLACWVEDTTRRLGTERTQTLLELSEAAGLLPPDVKGILIKLTTIKYPDQTYKPNTRDYFDSLVKIAALFGNNNEYNAALLLMLTQGDVHG